jgi:hypothetical protein
LASELTESVWLKNRIMTNQVQLFIEATSLASSFVNLI